MGVSCKLTNVSKQFTNKANLNQYYFVNQFDALKSTRVICSQSDIKANCTEITSETTF